MGTVLDSSFFKRKKGNNESVTYNGGTFTSNYSHKNFK